MIRLAVAAVFSAATDDTGPTEIFGGLTVLAATVAGAAAFRYRAASRRRAIDQIRSQERGDLARELHDMVAHIPRDRQTIGGRSPEDGQQPWQDDEHEHELGEQRLKRPDIAPLSHA